MLKITIETDNAERLDRHQKGWEGSLTNCRPAAKLAAVMDVRPVTDYET